MPGICPGEWVIDVSGSCIVWSFVCHPFPTFFNRENFVTRMPEWLSELVTDSVNNNPDDIDAGVEELLSLVQVHDEYDGFVDQMIKNALRDFIYDIRHKRNVQTRRDAGHYGTPAKVSVGTSNSVQEVYESLFDSYYIGGKVLGSLLGSELAGICEDQLSKANGHLFNHRLCKELLKRNIPDNVTVRDAIRDEREIQKIFKSAKTKEATKASAKRASAK